MTAAVSRIVDGVLVLCAIATTVAVVTRARSQGKTTEAGMIRFDGWREDLAFDRRIGRADAPYRLVVWTDYQCPACKKFEIEVDHVTAKLGDSVAIVYRHFPLENHPLAFRAAVAAECARADGRFEAMHRALFSMPLGRDSLPIQSLAEAAELRDVSAFRTCLDAPAKHAVVRVDMERGHELRIKGTPTLHIGDRIGTGGKTAEQLIPLLRSANR